MRLRGPAWFSLTVAIFNLFISQRNITIVSSEAEEPDPGGSDQQNLGYKKLKNRKTDRIAYSTIYVLYL